MVLVKVRERAGDDLEACEHLALAVHQIDGYPPRLPGDLRSFIASPRALGAWVAEEDGQIVGHVALHPDSSLEVMELASRATDQPPEGLGVVARLLVAQTHRRQGVGRALLDVARDAAHSAGLWPILDVATHFHGAIQLYEQTGWVFAGRVTVEIRGTEPLEELVYVGPAPLIPDPHSRFPSPTGG